MDKATRLSALSGNLDWKDSYDKSYSSLQDIMQRISSIAVDAIKNQQLQDLQTYLQINTRTEAEVYRLLGTGNKGLALQILDGWEYTKNRQAFEAAVANIVESIHKNIQDKIDTHNRLTLGLLALILLCLTLFLTFWGATYKLWREQLRLKLAAEEGLRHSEEKYRKLVDTSPDAIALVDEDGQIMAANPVLGKQLGQEQQDLVGQPLQEILPQEQAEQIMQNGNLALSSQEVVCRQETRQDKYYESYYIPVYALHARDSFQLVSKDITERQKAEQEREQLRMQMLQSQKLQSIGVLAAGVAHEFNNLLQIMSGNIQLLLMSKTDQDPDLKHLESVRTAVNRAAMLVKQLLLFSRSSSTMKTWVDPSDSVQKAINLLEQTLPRMIQVTFSQDEDLWPIYADPVQVEQVVVNLCTNAADAMPEGGLISIEARNVHPGSRYAHYDLGLDPRGYVLLRVQDTGLGMDAETLAQIFDPFFTTKEVGQGTGLGLSTVYGIVQSHAGHIQCSSTPDQGTDIRIYWPAGKSEEIPGAQRQEELAVQIQGGNETILVVDDEGAYQEVLRRVLDRSGYRVLVASSGEEALNMYFGYEQEIDLVILDLSMPGMGGRKCLLDILARDPEAKVLVASGYFAESKGQEMLQLGAAGFISKPFQLAELMFKVREVLSLH
ncbi:MAG: hybrid sensor histidine kinase/response regulator [Desulfohalobiaceae bacterium]